MRKQRSLRAKARDYLQVRLLGAWQVADRFGAKLVKSLSSLFSIYFSRQ